MNVFLALFLLVTADPNPLIF